MPRVWFNSGILVRKTCIISDRRVDLILREKLRIIITRAIDQEVGLSLEAMQEGEHPKLNNTQLSHSDPRKYSTRKTSIRLRSLMDIRKRQKLAKSRNSSMSTDKMVTLTPKRVLTIAVQSQLMPAKGAAITITSNLRSLCEQMKLNKQLKEVCVGSQSPHRKERTITSKEEALQAKGFHVMVQMVHLKAVRGTTEVVEPVVQQARSVFMRIHRRGK